MEIVSLCRYWITKTLKVLNSHILQYVLVLKMHLLIREISSKDF